MSKSIIAGVEIGTAKIGVLIAELYEDWTLNIIGFDCRTSRGIRKGELVDFRAASESVHDAIERAEASAGVRGDEVYMALSGGHLQGGMQVGSASVSGSDGRVRQEDIERAVKEAKRKALPADRVYIHHIRNPFYLDGRVVEEPLALLANKIEVQYWSIHADGRQVSDWMHLFNTLSIKVRDIILSSVASARMAVDESSRKGGCLVIDIGAGATDFALYADGYIVRTGVIPVGGDHLTNDLAIGLHLNSKRAEEVKKDLGKAVFEVSDSQRTIRLYGDNMIGDRSLPLSSVSRILEARVEEIFRLIGERLGDLLDPKYLAGGVVLTGGTSRLRQIETAASAALGVPARRADRLDWVAEDLRGPEFSTVLGVLHFGHAMNREEVVSDQEKGEGKGLLARISRLWGTPN